MSRVVEVVFPDQLVADVEPLLVQGHLELDDYVLEAVHWYTRYLHQERGRPGAPGWSDHNGADQALLLRQIHEEFAPYTREALKSVWGEDEADWEALLA